MITDATQFTVTVGLDSRTVEQFALTWPTWLKFHPWLTTPKWLLFYDVRALDRVKAESLRLLAAGVRGKLVCWQPIVEYESQRAKMLCGHLHVPPTHVVTPWYLKIDTDAVCFGDSDWPQDDWFTDPEVKVVASQWRYSKAKGTRMTIEQYAEALEAFGDMAYPRSERLNLAEMIDGNKIKHYRFASWLSFYRTSWAQDVKQRLCSVCGVDRAPVPSQDGVHHYCCQRHCWKWLPVKMKRYNWTNVPNFDKLRKLVSEVIDE